MEQNIKLLLFIKIAVFILLNWIYIFNRNINKFNKSFDQTCNIYEKLNTRNCRLLAKYNKVKDSNVASLTKDLPYNEGYAKKNIYNDEKGVERSNKQYNRNLLKKAQYYTEVIDYNIGIFDGKHFHFEKKWIKKKDYDNFLEKKRRICDIALKKIKFKNYGYIVAMFLIFIMFVIGIYKIPRLESLDAAWKDLGSGNILKTLYETVAKWDPTVKASIYLTSFSVIILISIILLVIGICKILKNNEKYNKIKLMTE
ncbi:fam-m protein [Plasmodium malariae]|uniref:Fam-m protein n=1 Tax=Plasmodium malariae TaxID=5858 RepID=A0A1D3JH73_PLAMA|nr:fam-m protein [Plasmodium malariae]SBT85651.1 fam-m protein [Plasmodium malariae]